MEYTALAAIVVVIIMLARNNPVTLVFDVVRSILTLRIRLMHGRRIAVVDGDTVRFRRRRLFGLLGGDFVKGRLRGIDAPEYTQPQGAGATHALRGMLIKGGMHLMISCRRDVYGRELMWIIGWRGPVGLRMLWRGQAFSTTIVGAPIAFVAKTLRRGMWGKGRVTDPSEWRMRNHHGLIR